MLQQKVPNFHKKAYEQRTWKKTDNIPLANSNIQIG